MSRLSPGLNGRVTRREIALSPLVWLEVALGFGIFAIALAVLPSIVDLDAPWRAWGLSLCLTVITVALLRRPAPEPDSPTVHVVIMLIAAGTTAGMFAMAPHSIAALPVAIFVGALAAIWLERRWQIAAHYALATVLVLLPSLTGVADTQTFVAVCTLIPPAWILGLLSLTILETAERQSEALEQMAMRDPLTGVGNRRLLEERLTAELQRRHGFTVFALDLDGFKAVNDRFGHAAGDQLLIEVGERLSGVAPAHATVVRQGGDEFCVIAPGVEAEDEIAALCDAIGAALAPVTRSGIGTATYPQDGRTADALLNTADARLTAAKASTRMPGGSRSELTVVDERWLRTARPAAAAATEPPALVSRKQLGASQWLWTMTGGVFVFYALAGLMVWRFTPQLVQPEFAGLVAFGGGVGVWMILTDAPPINTWRSNFPVTLSYVMPVAIAIACRPYGAVAIGTAVFIGPLVALRTTERWQAVLHISAATVLLGAVIVSGMLTVGSILALLILIGTMNALAVGSVVVFEAAEAQARELQQLGVTDQLTGLANRRRLGEVLDDAVRAHQPTAIVALDLNGFKALNDVAGHAAGDALLVEVARRLTRLVGGRGMVARPGGDEFTIVLPHASLVSAHAFAERVHADLGALHAHGLTVTTGIGVAVFPADGATADTVLDAADQRLIAAKYGREALPESKRA